MLVDVVPLLRDGAKLPRDVVRTITPIRGYLTIGMHRSGAGRRPDSPAEITSATVSNQPSGVWPWLLVIENARITTLKGAALVVVGAERLGHPTTGRLVPQAWWCRLVGGGGT